MLWNYYFTSNFSRSFFPALKKGVRYRKPIEQARRSALSLVCIAGMSTNFSRLVEKQNCGKSTVGCRSKNFKTFSTFQPARPLTGLDFKFSRFFSNEEAENIVSRALSSLKVLLQVFDKTKKWKLRQIVGCQKAVVKERQLKSSSNHWSQIFAWILIKNLIKT